MNIRTRKILTFRIVGSVFLLLSIALTGFVIFKVITLKPEKIILNSIALGLTASFAIAQIVLIMRGWKKESHLLDISFNTDGTINKFALVVVLVGTSLGIALDTMGLVVLFTRENTTEVICSMLIILSISSYLLLNCFIYLLFVFLFRKRELTLEDYAK